MDLLILGGTMFYGRSLSEQALARGHRLTLFTRGQHNADLFPAAERLHGDRDGGLEPLRGRRWDAVIDTCGYVPRVVRASVELLADAVEHYTFVSSISVYGDLSQRGITEESPLGVLADPSTEEVTGESYGPLKVLCEQAVTTALPGRALIIRPGLIVGPHDPTDRFTYWPARVARGGEVLAPGDAEQPAPFIDARDLAAWTLDLVEQRVSDVFHAVGPDPVPTMAELLETCRQESGSDARFTWVEESFLLEAGAQPWGEVPLWIPAAMEDSAGMNYVNTSKARAAGLRQRPTAETVRDTLAWSRTRPAGEPPRAGLSPEREAELLAAWHARAGAAD